MKVYIGPYTSWVGPYQIAEKLLFWKNRWDDNDSDYIHNLGDKLSKIPGLSKFCEWVYTKRKRSVKIRVDPYDCYSADQTLAMIIVPVLEKLQTMKHGSPNVDDEDVPISLRRDNATPLTEEQKATGHTDDLWEARWEYVLNEIIWAFRQHANPDWEEQFYTGETDIKIVDNQFVTGPNHTFDVDIEKRDEQLDRMENGRRLFAKYYESFWD